MVIVVYCYAVTTRHGLSLIPPGVSDSDTSHNTRAWCPPQGAKVDWVARYSDIWNSRLSPPRFANCGTLGASAHGTLVSRPPRAFWTRTVPILGAHHRVPKSVGSPGRPILVPTPNARLAHDFHLPP